MSGSGVERVGSAAALEALAPEWDRLAEACPWTTPFQRPEWLLPYCRVFEPGVAAVALRRDGRLAGLGLLEHRGRGGGPALVFLGAGPSDYLDLLAEPGAEEELWQAVLELVEEEAGAPRAGDDGAGGDGGAPACQLDEIPPGSPVPELAARDDGWHERIEEASLCPALPLPEPGTLEDALPPKQYERLCYDRRRARREGRLEAAEAPADDPGPMLQRLVELHRARWSEQGRGHGVLPERTARFHHGVARAFARRGELALFEVRVGGTPVASFYGFHHRRTLYYYVGGFDPSCSHLSPGVLAVGHAIEQALARGCRCFDFLRGAEPYKLRWGARPRRSRRVELLAPALAGSRRR
ncbi:MAG: GNAT family N-acetyltransferase [Thermoanaerobaculia bacterium]